MDVALKNIFKQVSFNSFIPFFYPLMMFPLRQWRKEAIAMLDFHPGQRVLIPGVGSGYDIPFIPDNVSVEGVDISDLMLGIAQAKAAMNGSAKRVHLSVMDAENLEFPSNSFDKAILGLFLTCVYDPKKAFAEVVRVVKPAGEILIYDHLVRKKGWSKQLMASLDVVMKYNFCSVVRRFEDVIEDLPVTQVKEIRGDPFGFIKGFLLQKNGTPSCEKG